MTFGVIIPAYNVERYIERAVRSVQAQSDPDWRCVVVDDGSRDGGYLAAVAAAADDDRIAVLRQPNAGQSVARNAGACELGDAAEFLLFLDGDDTLAPGALALLGRALGENPQSPGAFGAVRLVDCDDQTIGGDSGLGEPRTSSLFDAMLASPCPCPSAYLWRREAFDRIGGFEPRLRFAEDWHLALKMARGGDLVGLPAIVVNYRRHSGSLSSSGEDAGYESIRWVRRAIYTDPLTGREQRAELRRAWRVHNLGKAKEAIADRSLARVAAHSGLAAVGRPVDLSDLRGRAKRAIIGPWRHMGRPARSG